MPRWRAEAWALAGTSERDAIGQIDVEAASVQDACAKVVERLRDAGKTDAADWQQLQASSPCQLSPLDDGNPDSPWEYGRRALERQRATLATREEGGQGSGAHCVRRIVGAADHRNG